VARSPSESAKARVAIALEHGFEDGGRVKIWVDDKLMLDERLSEADVSRRLLLFKKRKGVFAHVLDVSPGRHTVRFEVEGDGEKRKGRLRGWLHSDQTRLLAVRASDKLKLEWKS
jgi:hypothetical protein